MDKLQELTEKLYNEGLSKGKEEGQAILDKAKAESEKILDAARSEAEAIIAQATREAEDMRIKAASDIRMASLQAIQATRSDIENLLVSGTVADGTKSALSSADFLKGIITAVAERFSAQEPQDIALILPESLRSELEPFLKGELAKALGKGVEGTFSKKIAGGFKIGPKDGSYFISMTDETFTDLISAYLRPATKKLLYGGNE